MYEYPEEKIILIWREPHTRFKVKLTKIGHFVRIFSCYFDMSLYQGVSWLTFSGLLIKIETEMIAWSGDNSCLCELCDIMVDVVV